MKKYIKILSLSFFTGFAFLACDKIEKDEYTITMDEPSWDGQCVLIEDFTGQDCPNCPLAAQVINELVTKYGDDKIIVLSEHVSKTINPANGSTDPRLLSNVAANYFKNFGGTEQTGLPSGVIQRVKNGANYLSDRRGEWAGFVIAQLYKKPKISLDLTVNEDLVVAVNCTLLTDYTDPINLIVLVRQDSIIAPQKENRITNDNYAHGHVLRDAITPTADNLSAGQWITAGPTAEGYTKKITLPKYEFPDNTYIKEHCSIVAIAVNSKTNEVLQCTAQHLH